MLKHYLDKHQDDAPEDMVFRMKVMSFKRTDYERHVHESVLIQQNRNQKSEFNRCSLPRLTVKLGDKELGDLAKTIREEQKKEDDLEQNYKMVEETDQKKTSWRMEKAPTRTQNLKLCYLYHTHPTVSWARI
jgi:hypothetical protein